MPNLYLPVAATIFSILLIIVYFSKKRISLLENKLYSIMLVVILIDSLLSSILFFNVYTNYNQFFVEMCNKVDYLQLLVWISCMYLYTYTITHNKEEKFAKKFKLNLILIIIINIFISILIFMANIEIVLISPIKQTAQGDSVNIAYFAWGFYMLLCGIMTLFNIKRINKKYIPIFVSLFLSVILFIIFSINPFLIVISICLTFINLVMYFTIENPDVQMLTQMELAKDEAEKANRHKSEFLSSMSHEIRTPLNAIKGFSEFIGDAKTLEEAKENAKDIVNASNVLLEIVGNVLDMSKIESGNIEIVDSDYNLYEIIDSIIKVVDYRFKEKNIALNINIAPDIPKMLYGDRAIIKKVLLNLLTNAVKYTNEGHVDFTVNFVNKEDICRLIISVEDTGRGIKPENISKLFTKFDRLEEDRNTTTEGTGLGLAITKHIVELMGGNITVQSVYGSGSKFTVTLNQRIKKLDTDQAVSSNEIKTKVVLDSIRDNQKLLEKKETISQPENQTNNVSTPNQINDSINSNSKKILLIDDNKLNLKVASKLLSNYGFQVEECMSGQECIDRINKGEKFDLLFADEMMPNMSGTQMMQTLKSRGYITPIVVLTADVVNNAKDKYVASGFDDYLGKPIDKQELDRILKKFSII